jgi:hypothetical protein
VLGADVEEQKVAVVALAFQAPLFGTELQCSLFFVNFIVPEPERTHFGSAGRVFFAQGVALPGTGHQDAG